MLEQTTGQLPGETLVTASTQPNYDGVAAGITFDFDPQITELVGEDALLELMRLGSVLDVLSELREVPDPFIQRKGMVADKSLLSDQATELLGPDNPLISTRKISVTRIPKNIGIARKVVGCINSSVLAINTVLASGRDAEVGLVSVQERVDQLKDETPGVSAANQEEGLSRTYDVADMVRELVALAGLLPSSGTVSMIGQVLEGLRDYELSRKKENSYVKRVAGPLQGLTRVNDKILERADGYMGTLGGSYARMRAFVAYLSSSGERLFSVLVDMAKQEELAIAEILLVKSVEAKEKLRPILMGSVDVSHNASLTGFEEFLIDRARTAREALESNKKLINPKKYVGFMRQLGILEVREGAIIAAGAELPEEQADVESFRKLVREANEVIRGGTLEYDDPVKYKTLSARLRKLTDEDGNHLLEPDESNLLIAMLNGRLGALVSTIEHAKSESVDLALAELEKSTPVAIQRIKGYDLTTAMGKLIGLIGDRQKRLILSKSLRTEELIRLDAIIGEYLEESSVAN